MEQTIKFKIYIDYQGLEFKHEFQRSDITNVNDYLYKMYYSFYVKEYDFGKVQDKRGYSLRIKYKVNGVWQLYTSQDYCTDIIKNHNLSNNLSEIKHYFDNMNYMNFVSKIAKLEEKNK